MPQTNNPEEKWQLIYNRHQAWKKKLKQRGIRPLTIIVTRDIRGCEQVAEELKDFLVEWEKLSPEQAADKVLPVSSSSKHQVNIAKLQVGGQSSEQGGVDRVGVHAQRRLGREERVPDRPARGASLQQQAAHCAGTGTWLAAARGWKGEEPMVTVFNHDAWSGRIKHLVNEILEIERRLTSTVDPASPHNFELHQP